MAILVVGGLVVGYIAPGAVPTVNAAIACQDAWPRNYHRGFFTSSPVYGVSGTIRDRQPVLCSNVAGATSASTAWIMLQGGGGPYEYAQVGYVRFAGDASARRFARRFIEYNDGESNWTRTLFGNIEPGTNHMYLVAYNFSTGKVSMGADATTLAITPFAVDTEWQPGWFAVYSGETLDAGDDIPGTAAAKTNFTSLQTKTCRGCSYGDPQNPTVISSLAAYKFEWVRQPTSMNIWTAR